MDGFEKNYCDLSWAIAAALDDPSFETKQKTLRLVVDKFQFRDDQITIKHVIPMGTVHLYRNQCALWLNPDLGVPGI